MWVALAGRLDPVPAEKLIGLLDVPGRSDRRREQRVSELERLRKGVFRSSSKGMVAALHRLADVQAAGVAGIDVAGVPPRRLVALATYGMAAKATLLRRLPREHRLAVLVATVVELAARATDDALELFDTLMTTELLSKAERVSANEKLRRYPRISRNAGTLAAAVKVLLLVDELDPAAGEQTLARVWELIEHEVSRTDLASAVAAIDELVPPTDAELDGHRMEELATVRPFLALLMDTVAFGATGDGPTDAVAVLAAMRTLAVLLAAKTAGRTTAGVKIGASFLDARRVDHDLVTGGWQRLVYPAGRPDGTVDRAAYTFCVLEQFHRHLKHRAIFAPGSSRWRDPRAHLLAGAAWEQARGPGLNALGLPEEPTGLLAEHAAALDAAYREVAARLGDATPGSAGQARVDAEGRLHLAALAAVPDPASLVDLRARVTAMLPKVDLPELVLEVMTWQPQLVEAFTHASGNEARVADLGLSVAAVLCAHAMNVGFTPVATPSVDALTRDRLHHVDANYVRFETIAAANTPLVAAQAQIPTVQAWGGGLVASVDGLRFVVPVRTVYARPNPRYFGAKRGITWLNMINDQAAGLAAKILSGTPRDSLHAVDVVLRQRSGVVPEAIISDTGSYSDIVFGLLHLLGRSYQPQLANLPDQKLWRIDPRADYGPLNQAARGRIDHTRISGHWEDMCRIAVSIHSGEVSAHEVTRMISRDGNPTPLGQAIAHYGRIFKSLHVLRLADDEPYRRQIKAQANLTEGRHDLARQVFHGRKGEVARAYYDGMEDQLSALGFVLNAVVLWNSVYLDRALAALRKQGDPVLDDDVARLSPFVRRHIGIDGHYGFHLPDLHGAHRPLRDPHAPDDE